MEGATIRPCNVWPWNLLSLLPRRGGGRPLKAVKRRWLQLRALRQPLATQLVPSPLALRWPPLCAGPTEPHLTLGPRPSNSSPPSQG